jgi:hypothetical protein
MSTDSKHSVDRPSGGSPRNPIERVIVWGGIGLLLVIVGIEARAQRGYSQSLVAVQDAFADNEEVQITLNDARKLMALGPAEVKTRSENQSVDHHQFSWLSLFKSGQYEITLRVVNDEEALVVSFSTPAAAEPAWSENLKASLAAADTEDVGLSGGGSGFQGGGNFPGGSRNGFRPPPNPLLGHLDTDGDDELSAEEIVGAEAVLLTLDKDGDGDLSLEEIDPAESGLRSGGVASGGFGSSESGESESPSSSRPRRPEIEE